MLKKYNVNTLVYLIGEVFTKVTPFILFPFISRVFGTEGLYLYTTYVISAFFIQSLFTGWLTPYLTVTYFKSKRRFNFFLVLSIKLLFFSLFSVCLLAVVLQSHILSDLKVMLIFSFISALSNSIFGIYLMKRQVEGKVYLFVGVNLFRSMIYLFVSLYLIFYQDINVVTLIKCHAVISVVFSMYLGFYLIKKNNVRNVISFKIFLSPLKFGLPLLPGLMLNNGRTAYDRFLIGLSASSAFVGIYSAAYQLATITMVFLTALLRSVIPSLLKNLKENKISAIRKQFKAFVATLFFICSISSISIYLFGAYYFGVGFEDITVFSMLPFIFLFQGIYDFFACYYQFHAKSNELLFISLSSFFIYALITYFGINFGLHAFCYSILLSVLIQSLIIYYHKGYNVFILK